MGDDKSSAARGNQKQMDEDQRSNDLGLVDESEDRVLQERKIASDLQRQKEVIIFKEAQERANCKMF